MREFSGKFLVYHLLEDGEWLRSHNSQPVDEERGSRVDAEVEREVAVFLNGLPILALLYAGFEFIHVESQVGCVLRIDVRAERVARE